MPRLVFRAAARRDLAAIAAYIEDESRRRAAADAFVIKLLKLLRTPGTASGRHGARLAQRYL